MNIPSIFIYYIPISNDKLIYLVLLNSKRFTWFYRKSTQEGAAAGSPVDFPNQLLNSAIATSFTSSNDDEPLRIVNTR